MSQQNEVDKIAPVFLAWTMLRIAEEKNIDMHDEEVREDLIKCFIDKGIGTKDRFEIDDEVLESDNTRGYHVFIKAIDYKE